MKILAINGSDRKNGTFSKILKLLDGAYSIEILNLSDYKLEPCSGCRTCFVKGINRCPLKGDYRTIFDKMIAADGVIFYSPTYVLNVSGLMKNFIDRFSFLCYDYVFINKPALLIASAREIGTKLTLFNLENAVSSWKFDVIGKFEYKTLEASTSAGYESKKGTELKKVMKKFYHALKSKKAKKPSMTDLVNFRILKYGFEINDDLKFYKKVWEKNGLLEKRADYYFNARINLLKKLTAEILFRLLIHFI